jgi:hypothetical protein
MTVSDRAGCGKIPYATKNEAQATLASIKRRKSRERRKAVLSGELHVYQCPRCHLWHLGR